MDPVSPGFGKARLPDRRCVSGKILRAYALPFAGSCFGGCGLALLLALPEGGQVNFFLRAEEGTKEEALLWEGLEALVFYEGSQPPSLVYPPWLVADRVALRPEQR